MELDVMVALVVAAGALVGWGLTAYWAIKGQVNSYPPAVIDFVEQLLQLVEAVAKSTDGKADDRTVALLREAAGSIFGAEDKPPG